MTCGVVTLLVSCVAFSLAVGVGYWEDHIYYTVLWRGHASGTWEGPGKPLSGYAQPGETQDLEVALLASDKMRYLRIEPSPQHCLGLPDLSIEVRLEDPDGKVAAHVSSDEIFHGYGSFESCHYWRQLTFKATKDGTYILRVTPYSWGISRADFNIREKNF